MLAGGLFPSSFLLPWAIAVAGLFACVARGSRRRRWERLPLLFGGGTLLFFSVSQSKRPGHPPALPVAAILVAARCARAR
jgi:hypothetical protein